MVEIFRFVLVLLLVLVIFNLIIIVHELGHFLAARWRGLVIERFGIWFGKPIWKKTYNGVEYSLGTIPAGGFVALPQMAPMESVEGRTKTEREKMPPVSVLDKIIVAFAGPLFSMLLAFVFAVGVWTFGRPTTESEATTVIGYVEEDSPAARAGLRPGDKVLMVDDKPVNRFGGLGNSITWRVIRSEGEKIPFTVERDGEVLTIYTEFVKEKTGRLKRAGLRQVRIAPKMTPKIDKVEPDTPAAAAGLQSGDLVVEVNGERIYNPIALAEAIQDNPDQPVQLKVQRDGQLLDFSIQPQSLPSEDGMRPRIGIAWHLGDIELVRPDPLEQIAMSLNTMYNMIGALVSPKSDVKAQHFSGPVGIWNIYYQMLTSEQGWRLALWFSVFLNVNLAILNLLPIPVLDGGHIMLAIIEGIRRKPVNVRLLEIIQGACAALIISYMLYVTFYDVQDLPWNWGKRNVPEASER